MKIIKTKFRDLKIIKHNNFADKRGFLKFTYNKKIINWDNFIVTPRASMYSICSN